MEVGKPIDGASLDAPVTGVGLVPGTLGDQLEASGDRVSLLVFLRHFGCIFCRETMADLRAASEADPDYPDVLFFFQGSATEGRAFLRRYWPEARAVADPELEFYDRFGVRRATFLEALGPQVVFGARRRARAKGHQNGPRDGDIWRMPGIFAVSDKKVVWAHQPKHAADHPDFAAISSFVSAAR
ncbi:MAG: SelL-related redox protein [Myxococcota bacterium]